MDTSPAETVCEVNRSLKAYLTGYQSIDRQGSCDLNPAVKPIGTTTSVAQTSGESPHSPRAYDGPPGRPTRRVLIPQHQSRRLF